MHFKYFFLNTISEKMCFGLEFQKIQIQIFKYKKKTCCKVIDKRLRKRKTNN